MTDRVITGKFLDVCSPALGPLVSSADVMAELGVEYASLAVLLEARNGFYAFSRALHVFPLHSTNKELGLIEWNDPDRWRSSYPFPPPSGVFFAEDVFGGQFWTGGRHVCFMDEESGELRSHSSTLEDWISKVLETKGDEVGAELAREWTDVHGEVQSGRRLAPKIPFILRGSSSLENIYAADAEVVMSFRGDLASALKEMPDGTRIKLKVKASD
jgi:hypothetical protein